MIDSRAGLPGRSRASTAWETTYDAEYLAVTKLQADALVTVDPALATRAKGLVPLAQLQALTEERD